MSGFCLSDFSTSPRCVAVNLCNYLQMDPHLLVGLINTELRNHCESLDDLVKTHHLDETELVGKLAGVGYIYLPESKQFR